MYLVIAFIDNNINSVNNMEGNDFIKRVHSKRISRSEREREREGGE